MLNPSSDLRQGWIVMLLFSYRLCCQVLVELEIHSEQGFEDQSHLQTRRRIHNHPCALDHHLPRLNRERGSGRRPRLPALPVWKERVHARHSDVPFFQGIVQVTSSFSKYRNSSFFSSFSAAGTVTFTFLFQFLYTRCKTSL